MDYNLGTLLDDIHSNLEDVGPGLVDVPIDQSVLLDLAVLPSSRHLGGGKVYERVKEVLGRKFPPRDQRLAESHSTDCSSGGMINSPHVDPAHEVLSWDGDSSNGTDDEGRIWKIPPKIFSYPSRISKQRSKSLRSEFFILSGFAMDRLEFEQRIYTVVENSVLPIYLGTLIVGLRFPIHGFLSSIFRYTGICPSKFLPNLIRMIGFMWQLES